MAGPQTIQQNPRSLVPMLKMKGTGDSPHELAANLIATIDATPFYKQDQLRSTRGNTVNLGAPGFWGTGGVLMVPQGKVWFVQHLSLHLIAALPAGVGMDLTFALLRGTAISTAFQVLSTAPIPFNPGDSICIGQHFDPNLICYPGDTFFVGATSIVGVPAGITPSYNCEYFEIDY